MSLSLFMADGFNVKANENTALPSEMFKRCESELIFLDVMD